MQGPDRWSRLVRLRYLRLREQVDKVRRLGVHKTTKSRCCNMGSLGGNRATEELSKQAGESRIS